MDNNQLNYRLDEFFRILTQLVEQGKEQTQRLGNIENDVVGLKSDIHGINETQKEHTQILNRLEAKTDNIATKVLEHEIRLAKAEQNIEDLRGGIH